MVAAEGEEKAGAIQDRRRLCSNGGVGGLRQSVVDGAIAVVDDRQPFEEIASEGILRVIVEDGRSASQRLRPETCAAAIGDGTVEGDSPDGDVARFGCLGELAAHEGERAGIGRIAGCAQKFARGETVVDRLAACHA